MKITIALPFNNELDNLKILIPKICEILNYDKEIDYELNLVDDLSNDGSYEFCKKFILENKLEKKINLFRLEKKGFQSGALKKAFDQSNGDYIISMDTDLQDDPKYLPQFLDNIKKNFDVIIGVRVNRKAPSLLKSGLKVYDYIFEKMFALNLTTYRAPYVAYNKEFIFNLPWYNNDHRYLIPIAISRGAKKITQIEVNLNERLSGSTHYNKYLKVFSGVIELFRFILRLKKGIYKKNK